MHLSYNTTVCYRSVSRETGKSTWKRILGENAAATLLVGNWALLKTGEVDSRVASSMTQGGAVYSDTCTMHCLSLRLVDAHGSYDRIPLSYPHSVVDITGVMRRIRCRRACLILAAKLKEPRGRDVAQTIAQTVWTMRFNQAWDRE